MLGTKGNVENEQKCATLHATHQLLDVFSNVLAQCNTGYEEVDSHPSSSVLLRHGNVLDGGDVKWHGAAIDGQQKSFFLHVHFQLLVE